jgi:hypothetical protein
VILGKEPSGETSFYVEHKSQHRNTRNMKKTDNMTPPRVHNLLGIESKDIIVDEMLDKQFNRLFFKNNQ